MSDTDTGAEGGAEHEDGLLASDQTDGKVAEGEGEEGEPSEELIRIATRAGWKPKDKYKGPEGEWSGPAEYLDGLRDRARRLTQEAKTTRGKLDRVTKTVTDYQKRLSERRSADRDALLKAADSDDAATRREALGKLADLDALPATPGQHPAVADFAERNAAWYDIDDDATAYVAALDKRFAAEAGGVTDPTAHMKRIETAVKKRFPELFEDREEDEPEPAARRRTLADRKPTPMGGSGSRAPGRSGGPVTAASLTSQERQAAKDMGVSPESYAANKQKMIERQAANG